MITQITGEAGSGKTTNAIKQLLESGGGLFITRLPSEITVFKQRHPELVKEFANKITVVEVFDDEKVVIDDADSLNLTMVVSSIAKENKNG